MEKVAKGGRKKKGYTALWECSTTDQLFSLQQHQLVKWNQLMVLYVHCSLLGTRRQFQSHIAHAPVKHYHHRLEEGYMVYLLTPLALLRCVDS